LLVNYFEIGWRLALYMQRLREWCRECNGRGISEPDLGTVYRVDIAVEWFTCVHGIRICIEFRWVVDKPSREEIREGLSEKINCAAWM
jgi:hypothetical protein